MISGLLPDTLKPCSRRANPLVKYSFRYWYCTSELNWLVWFAEISGMVPEGVAVALVVLLNALAHPADRISPLAGVLATENEYASPPKRLTTPVGRIGDGTGTGIRPAPVASACPLDFE